MHARVIACREHLELHGKPWMAPQWHFSPHCPNLCGIGHPKDETIRIQCQMRLDPRDIGWLCMLRAGWDLKCGCAAPGAAIWQGRHVGQWTKRSRGLLGIAFA
jgi:hypothetical protein